MSHQLMQGQEHQVINLIIGCDVIAQTFKHGLYGATTGNRMGRASDKRKKGR
jgi:hypothetical protein